MFVVPVPLNERTLYAHFSAHCPPVKEGCSEYCESCPATPFFEPQFFRCYVSLPTSLAVNSPVLQGEAVG